MFCESDRNCFSPSPDTKGSESLIHYPLASQRFVCPDPVLRFRYNTDGVLGERIPNANAELARFHIHRFARLMLEADPLGYTESNKFAVAKVVQGSRAASLSFPSSISERVEGTQLLDAEANRASATILYNKYRNYGFAHDFHGLNTFRQIDGSFVSIELLDVLSPEALRALSLRNMPSELTRQGIRACAWASALGVFSSCPLPPAKYTRREVPLSPESRFTLSIIDLTYFWRELYAQPFLPGKAFLTAKKSSSPQIQEHVRACKVFGRSYKKRGPLDLENGTNINDFGISREVFDLFLSSREQIRSKLLKMGRVP
jgi:hypothetical protein